MHSATNADDLQARTIDTTTTMLCTQCQQGQPNPKCPACLSLRNARELLALPHTDMQLAAPTTITVLDKRVGVLVLQRRNDPTLAIAGIGLGTCVIGLMSYIFVVSGMETLLFVIPLVLFSLAGIVFGIRQSRYRQNITLERGTLTVTVGKTSTSMRDIEQLVVDGKHATWWHKGLRWGATYQLLAQANGARVLVLSGAHDEVRFVEAEVERALRIVDDPARNVLATTTFGS